MDLAVVEADSPEVVDLAASEVEVLVVAVPVEVGNLNKPGLS